MKNRIIIFLTVALWIAILNSCQKEADFLSAKTNQALAVPSTLDDYFALLKNENLFNRNEPLLGTITADDDYYLTSETWNNVLSSAAERNAYIWAEDIYENEQFDIGGWQAQYEKVFVANTVLDGLKDLGGYDNAQLAHVKGTALYFRSLAFYNLVQTFAEPYNPATAETDLGIPLRLTANINLPSRRNTLSETYDQIFSDLTSASELLPGQTAYVTLPAKPTVFALLARIHLAIAEYDKALVFAEKCLLITDRELTDYNTLNPGVLNISATLLGEDIFHTSLQQTSFSGINATVINPELYQLYAEGDLRRAHYFTERDQEIRFRGTYDFRNFRYSGIALDEIYLIKAECLARKGDADDALVVLNELLEQRFEKGTFVPYVIDDAKEVLDVILLERRKSLLYRGLRWTDIKRLNRESGREVTITRTVNGVGYTLSPGDRAYALPIPKIEIELSGMQQNVRR